MKQFGVTSAGQGGGKRRADNAAIGLALRGVLDRVSLKACVIAAAILRSYTPDSSPSVAGRFALWSDTNQAIRLMDGFWNGRVS
jgi:hypothetical protein